MEDEVPLLVPDPAVSRPPVPAALSKEEGKEPVPITVLAGWLGAGKTTLLGNLLRGLQARGQTVAIIQNEASTMGVEDALPITDESGAFSELLELGGGCVCCSVKTDFISALETLMARRRFDYVVLECSGVADPGQLAALFWVDEELESSVYLDGIVGVVDAVHLEGHLKAGEKNAESAQIINQLAYADRILLNKIDLLPASDASSSSSSSTPSSTAASTDDTSSLLASRAPAISRLSALLHSINPSASILPTVRSNVRPEDILSIRAFEQDDAVAALARAKATQSELARRKHAVGSGSGSGTEAGLVATHACDSSCGHSHDDAAASSSSCSLAAPVHDHSITHLVLESTDPGLAISLEKLKWWLADILWGEKKESSDEEEGGDEKKAEEAKEGEGSAAPMKIFRMKAIMSVAGSDTQHFLQAVQELFDLQPGAAWKSKAERHTRLLIIGRHLDNAALEQGFRKCFERND